MRDVYISNTTVYVLISSNNVFRAGNVLFMLIKRRVEKEMLRFFFSVDYILAVVDTRIIMKLFYTRLPLDQTRHDPNDTGLAMTYTIHFIPTTCMYVTGIETTDRVVIITLQKRVELYLHFQRVIP